MPEPIHDFRPVFCCGECLREITSEAVVIYGVTYHKSCWQRTIDEARYESATDADYDALYEPTDGGES